VSPEELLSYFFSLGFSKELAVLIISALPVVELRLALPVAIIGLEMLWYYALPLAIIGNLLPVPFILLFLNTTSRFLSKIDIFNRMLQWLFERTRRRGKIVERYERIGLTLFVAIPLPVTGAWTGSIVAVLFGLKFRHAFLSIFIGVLIAGVIVTCATLLGWTLFGLWRA
jgi:uncharacterized membrane protein